MCFRFHLPQLQLFTIKKPTLRTSRYLSSTLWGTRKEFLEKLHWVTQLLFHREAVVHRFYERVHFCVFFCVCVITGLRRLDEEVSPAVWPRRCPCHPVALVQDSPLSYVTPPPPLPVALRARCLRWLDEGYSSWICKFKGQDNTSWAGAGEDVWKWQRWEARMMMEWRDVGLENFCDTPATWRKC